MMKKDIVLTSNSDLRSEWTRLGLSGKIKQIKCVIHVTDAKPSAVSSGREATTGISTILKHAFAAGSKAFFYITTLDTAMMLKLGAAERFSLAGFDITDRQLFDKRLRMAEVVAVLTKRAEVNKSLVAFQLDYEAGAYQHIVGPIITQDRVNEAYNEFMGLVKRGIKKHSHPAHFQRISYDRGLCAAGIAECVKRIQ
jgi:hypothetical protein